MMKQTLLFLSLLISSTQIIAQNTIKNHLITSTYLQEDRMISVALPDNYENSGHNYPVLFLLDGEYSFDYAKGLTDFYSNEFGYYPEIIVVSIPNTIRERDMTVSLDPNDPFIHFTKFINEELAPHIDSTYRSNGFNMLFGFSSSSGICGYFLTELPNTFNAYILSGTGIGEKFKALIAKRLNNEYFPQKVFFYANTEKGLREPYLRRYETVIDSLKPKNLIYEFEVFEGSHANTIKAGLDNGLKHTFSDFQISEAIALQGYEKILEYFEELNQKYTGEFTIPIGTINELAGILYYNNKKDDAIELVKYGIGIHPYSSTLCGTLAEIYIAESQIELGIQYYKKALMLSSNDTEENLKYNALLNEVSK